MLFQENGDLHAHEATVIGLQELTPDTHANGVTANKPDSHIVYLDETIFHVQGGGQPADVGHITSEGVSFEVTGVRAADEGKVHHFGHFDNENQFVTGDNVKLGIDVDRRILNSRLHTAGHVLGMAVRGLSREGKIPHIVETKASHYPGEARIEMEGLIEGKHKEAIQAATNELVKEALPIKICFWTAKECQDNEVELPEKMVKEEGRLFRAILIEGKGAYACGGTHVADTSGVGEIVVKKISRQKGITKISYDVK